MRGYPKHLNTKFDYELVRKQFPKQWKSSWQALLDSRMVWKPGTTLQDAKGITDKTHKVVETLAMNENGEESKARVQLELVEDPNARLFRLGFTVKEVQDAVAGK